MAFVFLYLLWAFPYSRLVHGGKDLRVYHGLLRWHYETAGVATYRLVRTIMTIGVSLAGLIAIWAVVGTRLGSPEYQRPGHCPHCGYPFLRGRTSGFCPECGKSPASRRRWWGRS